VTVSACISSPTIADFPAWEMLARSSRQGNGFWFAAGPVATAGRSGLLSTRRRPIRWRRRSGSAEDSAIRVELFALVVVVAVCPHQSGLGLGEARSRLSQNLDSPIKQPLEALFG
jgi:hypothetical protein